MCCHPGLSKRKRQCGNLPVKSLMWKNKLKLIPNKVSTCSCFFRKCWLVIRASLGSELLLEQQMEAVAMRPLSSFEQCTHYTQTQSRRLCNDNSCLYCHVAKILHHILQGFNFVDDLKATGGTKCNSETPFGVVCAGTLYFRVIPTLLNI